MFDKSVAEPAANSNIHATSSKYRVLYDGQCELCQACVAWLKILDQKQQTLAFPISEEVLSAVDPRLRLDECLRQLHVVTPRGEVLVGWDAVRSLAALFPTTWLIGVLGGVFPFRNAGRLLYGFIARNLYSLSKCRGGACRVAKPDVVRRRAKLGAFWSCYTFGFLIRFPLVLWAGTKVALQRVSLFARTYHERLDLLDGKLTILFLNGFLPNTVPLLFGELFTAVLYDGVAVDPGSPKMRTSLERHFGGTKPKIAKIIATHAHAGDWLRRYKDVPPTQQREALESDPRFRNLPPQRQEKLRQQLDRFNTLPPEKQQRVLNRMETWEHLTPNQKSEARQLYSQFRNLPPQRRQALDGAIRSMRTMTPEQRQQFLNSGQSKKMFSPQEQDLLGGISRLPLAAGETPQNESPEE